MICPKCNGKKQIVLSIMPGRVVGVPCYDCGATGIVDDRHPQWKIAGAKLKHDRIAGRETLWKFCKRVGIDANVRSRQERGLSDPKEAISVCPNITG